MPRLMLTARGVQALKPDPTRRVDYWSADPSEPGFGVRVFPSGSKSWFVWTRRTRLGRPVRLTLGAVGKLGLAEAREKARDERARVQVGEDPAAERREERAARRDTVGALFDRYCDHVGVRRQAGEFNSWPDVRRSLERDVLPIWKDRPVRELRRKDVVELVTQKALTGLVAANRLQAHISMLLSFAVEADWIDVNPARGIRKRPERPRERVVSASEIKALWTYLDSESPLALARGIGRESRIMPAETAATIKACFKVLLLAGQRLGETARMAWADVDLDARTWTIPATVTKNRVAHRVPLSRPVLAILEERQGSGSPWVFPSTADGRGDVLVWAKRAAVAIGSAVGVTFHAHDLRRTLASGLGELGVSSDTIGLVLNHRKPGVTGRHYDLSTRERAKREALDLWADHVQRIASGKTGRVVAMRRRQS